MARRDVIIALAVFAAALVLRAALLSAPPHDYDEGVYWQSLLAMHDGYAQYRDIFVSQPPLFLGLTYVFFAVLGKSLLAARIAGLCGSLLAVACGAWIAFRIGGRVAGLVALVFLAFNAVDFAEAVTLQAEALAIGLAALSAALAVERTSAGRGSIGIAAAAGAFAACAVLVKLLAIACIVPFVVIVLYKRDVRGFFAYVAGAALTVLAIVAPHLSAFHQMVAQTVTFHLMSSNVGWPVTRLATMAGGLHVPLVLLAAIGAGVSVWRKNVAALGVTAWLVAVFITFFKISPLFPHHLDAIQVPLAILAAYAVAEGAKHMRIPLTAGIVAVALAVEVWYCAGAIQRLLHVRHLGISASLLSATVPAKQWVITDLQATAASAAYRTPPDLVDTSLVRVRSGNLTSDELIRDAGDPRVGAVVFGGRRLTLPQLRPFARWVHTHFRRTASAAVWIR